MLDLCNGGCPKDRFIATPDGEPGLNYLCAGLKQYFGYTRPYLRRMAAAQHAKQPMDEFMRDLRAEEAGATAGVSRNDPCPCGSGKKYKRCCRNLSDVSPANS